MGRFSIFSIILFLFFALSIYSDARRHGKNPLFPLVFLAITFVYPLAIILLPIYYLFRGSSIRFSNPMAKNQKISMTKMCSKCGTDNPPGNTECSQCGNKLSLQ